MAAVPIWIQKTIPNKNSQNQVIVQLNQKRNLMWHLVINNLRDSQVNKLKRRRASPLTTLMILRSSAKRFVSWAWASFRPSLWSRTCKPNWKKCTKPYNFKKMCWVKRWIILLKNLGSFKTSFTTTLSPTTPSNCPSKTVCSLSLTFLSCRASQIWAIGTLGMLGTQSKTLEN